MQIFDKQSIRTGETLVKDVDYREAIDGNGTIHKVVNFDNPKYAKRIGVAEVIPMRFAKGQGGTPKHDNKKVFTRFTDKKTGLIWGIPMDIDSVSKELIWKRFSLEDSHLFDLSDWEQAALFAIIKNGVFCEGSPNLLGKPSYKIKDKVEEAEKKIASRSLRRQAEDIIRSFSREQMRESAILNGVNIAANSNAEMLEDEVYRVMELDPSKFLNIHNNPNREYIAILKKGLASGIIVFNIQTNTFMYGGIPMGFSEDSAVKYLFDNKGTASTINAILLQNEKDSIAAMTVPAYEPKKVAEIPVEFKSPFEAKNEEPIVELSEIEVLKQRAKDLGVKGAHLMKDGEMLRKKIEEAEK